MSLLRAPRSYGRSGGRPPTKSLSKLGLPALPLTRRTWREGGGNQGSKNCGRRGGGQRLSIASERHSRRLKWSADLDVMSRGLSRLPARRVFDEWGGH